MRKPTEQSLLGKQSAVDVFAGEWISAFPKACGVKRMGRLPLFDDPRIHWLAKQSSLRGKRILELGPLEGGHTYMLSHYGAAAIVAVEADENAYLRCLVSQQILGFRADFRLCNFIEYLSQTTETFDLCVASGVLYHMHDPLGLLKLIAARCEQLFVWTHAHDAKAQRDQVSSEVDIDGHTIKLFDCQQFVATDVSGKASRTARILDQDDLRKVLTSNRFVHLVDKPTAPSAEDQLPVACFLASKQALPPVRPLFLWVIGCPRSGTTFLTRLLGRNVDLEYNEPGDPVLARGQVQDWHFPEAQTVVFKWCENFEVAREIIARFPNSYFLHTLREPANNVNSIAFPKADAFPPRDFPEVGTAADERVEKSIRKWMTYTAGCLEVAEQLGEHYIPVNYHQIPQFYSVIERRTGLKIARTLPFKARDLPLERLAKLETYWTQRPRALSLRQRLETIMTTLEQVV